jgi:ribosomal protein S18 acetylase RimI-like enzyme
MKILENVLTATDFIKLYESAGWGKKCEDIVQVSLENSYVTFAVFEEENVIGMARLLGDGGMAFYLKDFVILSEFQGKGIGKELLDYVQKYIRAQLKDGWQTKLELMSAKGKEEFYKKFGFEEMPSQYIGAGMAKMIQ